MFSLQWLEKKETMIFPGGFSFIIIQHSFFFFFTLLSSVEDVEDLSSWKGYGSLT